jgi:hypothetical protein
MKEDNLKRNAFNEWIFKVCSIKAENIRRDVHDLFPMIDLTDAKLSFISGETPEEYSKTINLNY